MQAAAASVGSVRDSLAEEAAGLRGQLSAAQAEARSAQVLPFAYAALVPSTLTAAARCACICGGRRSPSAVHVRLALPRRRHNNLWLQAAVQWVYKHEHRSPLTFLKSICKTMQTSCTATEAARDAAAGDAARLRGELAAMTSARDAALSDLAAAREQLASFRESSGKTAEVLAAEQALTAALTQRNQAQVCGFAHISVKCFENHLAPCPLLLDD